MVSVLEREYFYQARDNRTLLFAESDYRNKKVLITINDHSLDTFDGQVMLFTAFNLTCRFCSNIDIQCNLSTKTIYLAPKFNQAKISDALIQAGSKIDPYGKFTLVDAPKESYDGVLSIGNSQSAVSNQINIDNDGWLAYLNKPKEQTGKSSLNSNPIGAGVAACLGVCEIFKKLVPANNYCQQMGSFCFSALDYSLNKPDAENPPLPKEIKLGNIQIIGVGAVGSAVIAFLDFLPIEGNIELIDNERVDTSNLNRYFIATTDDACRPARAKVDVAESYLSQKKVGLTKFNGLYEDYVEKNGQG